MKRFSNIFLLLILISLLNASNFPDKRYLMMNKSVAKVMGREDRKDGVHSGNRVLTRIYNHGAIGDQSSSFSGVYPIGSGPVSYTHLTLPTNREV